MMHTASTATGPIFKGGFGQVEREFTWKLICMNKFRAVITCIAAHNLAWRLGSSVTGLRYGIVLFPLFNFFYCFKFNS